MVKRWTRWHDWAAVVLGVVTGLSVLVVDTSTRAMWVLVIFGVLLLVGGLWSLSMPGSVSSEYVHIGLGVLLFISPWALGYSALVAAAWVSWVIGALAVILGALAVPLATTSHRGMAGQH